MAVLIVNISSSHLSANSVGAYLKLKVVEAGSLQLKIRIMHIISNHSAVLKTVEHGLKQ